MKSILQLQFGTHGDILFGSFIIDLTGYNAKDQSSETCDISSFHEILLDMTEHIVNDQSNVSCDISSFQEILQYLI